MHGNDLTETPNTLTYKVIVAMLDREARPTRAQVGYMSYSQTGFGDNEQYESTYQIDTGPAFVSKQWYQLSLQRTATTTTGVCRLRFLIQPINRGGRPNGQLVDLSTFHNCEDIENTVGTGGSFGLVSNQPVQFKNFATLSTATGRFSMYFPFCPRSGAVAVRLSRLLGVPKKDVIFYIFFFLIYFCFIMICIMLICCILKSIFT